MKSVRASRPSFGRGKARCWRYLLSQGQIKVEMGSGQSRMLRAGRRHLHLPGRRCGCSYTGKGLCVVH